MNDCAGLAGYYLHPSDPMSTVMIVLIYLFALCAVFSVLAWIDEVILTPWLRRRDLKHEEKAILREIEDYEREIYDD